ncbi:MAG: hypothetical protein PHQ43_10735 [Dehalococcoidales bacterium]|nr:hypothetical protein [Dehalococcoidales bacterium]
MTTQEYIEKHGIHMAATKVDRNPNMDAMPAGSTHWICLFTINSRGGAFDVYFSMGPALAREPSAVEVLECMADDAAGIENTRSFERWAAEYGYDADSRRAERIYKLTKGQSRRLRKFLLADAYEELLWNTSRG